MKTAELTGALLDYWVAKACGYTIYGDRKGFGAVTWVAYQGASFGYLGPGQGGLKWNPSGDWAQGGPIIDREKITTSWDDQKEHERGYWFANYEFPSDTLLVAAMRAYVASKFGEEVPDVGGRRECSMIDNRISAGELRATGVPIPDSIPDCATVNRAAIRHNVISTSSDRRSGTMSARIAISFSEPFEWVDFSMILACADLIEAATMGSGEALDAVGRADGVDILRNACEADDAYRKRLLEKMDWESR